MGLRFDTVIACYILLLPYLILGSMTFFRQKNKYLHSIAKYFILIFGISSILICAIDIPFFLQFFSRLSVEAFQWMDQPEFVLGMIVEEPRYWFPVVPFSILCYFFIKYLNRIFSSNAGVHQISVFKKSLMFFVGLILLFMGMRGRLDEKSPIRVGTAYFSNDPFFNQLGLNPNFTFIKSLEEKFSAEGLRLHFMESEAALSKRKLLFPDLQMDTNGIPFRRMQADSSLPTKMNLVVVLMESMCAAKMSRHGNSKKLTPFLDSLSRHSIYFENAYTAGTHTMNGIFSSIFSMTELYGRHPMKSTQIPHLKGLFYALKNNDYSTIYFTTHDGQFDNVEGFLRANDCEQVVSKSDYPSDRVKTTLGVPDDYMFEFSIPLLNKLSQLEKPFSAVFMTASDHGPYYIPPYFKSQFEEVKDQIVEYADFSLQKFMELASAQSWYQNTLFVFMADHGSAFDHDYEMSLDHHHSPLIFYIPNGKIRARTELKMAGQIDILPTALSLMQIPFEHYGMGIDLMKESRPYIYFSDDQRHGVLDQEWFYILRKDGQQSLYRYRNRDKKNYVTEEPERASRMDEYLRVQLENYVYIREQHQKLRQGKGLQ